MTPTHAAVLPIVKNSLAMLREAIDGLPDEATAWTPAPNTNSVTVLTIHSLTSIRFFLGNGSGRVRTIGDYRTEDRTPAFASQGESAAALVARIDNAIPELEALLAAGSEDDLTTAITWPPEDAPNLPATGVGCLFHAVAHLREHVGQAQLMRDLWFARSA
jgi:uncharacterized damage-inducible protein DinB